MTKEPHLNIAAPDSPARLIRQARLALELTQAQLAAQLHVSAKAVSKWERDAGRPDAALIPALAGALGLSSSALLSGSARRNPPDPGNMKRIRFCQCPECGAIAALSGKPEITCCARQLIPMKAVPADAAHTLTITDVETEKLARWSHPMDKAHHLTFLAVIGDDCVHIVRLYPEGAQERRLPRIPYARYACACSQEPGTLYISK